MHTRRTTEIHYNGPNTLLFVSAIFGFVGFIFALISVLMWLSVASVSEYEGEAEGYIIRNELVTSRVSGETSMTYHPIVSFTAADGTYIEDMSNSGQRPAKYHPGQTVVIKYDIDDPYVWFIEGDNSMVFLAVIFSFGSVCLIVFGVFAFIKHLFG